MANPTLYWNQYSICSLFSRYTLDLANAHGPASDRVAYDLETIDIYTNEQLEEAYLKINPRGQVPTLVVPGMDGPLFDSEDITLWVAERHHPWLLPAEHEREIRSLKSELHALGFAVLTFHGYAQRGDLIFDGVTERLSRPDTSEAYRRMLEYKATYMKELFGKMGGFTDEALIKAEADVRHVLARIEGILPSRGRWLFDGARPTLLEGTVITLIARLHDTWRDDLIPPAVDRWAQELLHDEVWQAITGGRKTWWYAENGTAKPPASRPETRD